MKKILTTAVALASMVSVSFAAAGVAELGGIKGKVLVNQGEGFVAVTGSMVLAPGAQVMVGEDGQALISYLATDCKVSVAPAAVTTVAAAAPCAAGEIVGAIDGAFAIPAADFDPPAAAVFPIWPILLGLGGVAVVTTVILTDDNGDSGSSADEVK
jgi:hypothetical protein